MTGSTHMAVRLPLHGPGLRFGSHAQGSPEVLSFLLVQLICQTPLRLWILVMSVSSRLRDLPTGRRQACNMSSKIEVYRS
jgi:hypothetical protein